MPSAVSNKSSSVPFKLPSESLTETPKSLNKSACVFKPRPASPIFLLNFSNALFAPSLELPASSAAI